MEEGELWALSCVLVTFISVLHRVVIPSLCLGWSCPCPALGSAHITPLQVTLTFAVEAPEVYTQSHGDLLTGSPDMK